MATYTAVLSVPSAAGPGRTVAIFTAPGTRAISYAFDPLPPTVDWDRVRLGLDGDPGEYRWLTDDEFTRLMLAAAEAVAANGYPSDAAAMVAESKKQRVPI